jgi:hypothetical protein
MNISLLRFKSYNPFIYLLMTLPLDTSEAIVPALAVMALFCVWRQPGRQGPGIIVGLNLVAAALVLAHPLAKHFIQADGRLTLLWSLTLVVVVYSATLLLVLDLLIAQVPAVAALVEQAQHRVNSVVARIQRFR